jgi:hypothetical protein
VLDSLTLRGIERRNEGHASPADGPEPGVEEIRRRGAQNSRLWQRFPGLIA